MFSDWVGQRAAQSLVARARLDVTERNGRTRCAPNCPARRRKTSPSTSTAPWVSITRQGRTRRSSARPATKLLYSERSHESYARTFELPQAVDSGAADAKFEDGVLTLTLPKKDAPKSTRVSVR